MEKPELIGYVGVIGSGKDHNCKILQSEGYTHVNFADALRELTWNTLQWSPKNDLQYERFKKQKFKFVLPSSKSGLGIDLSREFRDITGREILQRLGELSRQTFGEDCWIRAFENKISKLIKEGHTKFCTSDIRYPNELEAVQSSTLFRSQVIFTDYRSPKYNSTDPHTSEKMAQEFLEKGFTHMSIIWLSK